MKNCSIKHSVSDKKKYIELADLKRNIDINEDYILFNGIDSDFVPDNISIHFADRTVVTDNKLKCKVSDIYIYHIYQEKLKIDGKSVDEIFDKCVDYKFTGCMDIDYRSCNFNDKRVFKHGRNTSTRTIVKIFVEKNILCGYDFFDRDNLTIENNIVVYTPYDGFITHIPVDDNSKPYTSIEGVPEYYNAILKIDHTNLTDDNWIIVMDLFKNGFNKNNVVRINPKRDHKKQFRIQCSILTDEIKDCLCSYDNDIFKLSDSGYIKSFDEFIDEMPLW